MNMEVRLHFDTTELELLHSALLVGDTVTVHLDDRDDIKLDAPFPRLGISIARIFSRKEGDLRASERTRMLSVAGYDLATLQAVVRTYDAIRDRLKTRIGEPHRYTIDDDVKPVIDRAHDQLRTIRHATHLLNNMMMAFEAYAA